MQNFISDLIVLLVILVIALCFFLGEKAGSDAKENREAKAEKLMTECQKDYKEYECYIKLGVK